MTINNSKGNKVCLGKRNEHLVRELLIDFGNWFDEYGEPTESGILLEVDGELIEHGWEGQFERMFSLPITKEWTSFKDELRFQFVFTKGNLVKKSMIYEGMVKEPHEKIKCLPVLKID